jgi:hypothetical protein
MSYVGCALLASERGERVRGVSSVLALFLTFSQADWPYLYCLQGTLQLAPLEDAAAE